MSDFLTRMAQRSRGQAAVVSPRLPSLFAPVEDTGPAETTLAVRPQRRSAAPPAETTHPSAATADKDRPPPTPHVQRLSEPPIDDRLPTRPSHKTAKATPRTAPAGSNPAMPDGVAPLAAKGRDAPAPPMPPRNPAAAPLLKDRAQTAVPVTSYLAVDSAVSPAERTDRLRPPPATLLVPDYKTGPGTPQEALAELPAAVEQSAGQEGPTVHINIGRVEVRAQTATPATVPKPARPGPQSSLSLKNYLRRNGDRP